MTTAKRGDAVKIRFTAKSEGLVEVHESGELEFRIGDRKVLPGLEEMVIGMEPDEEREHRVSSENAFGEWKSGLVVDIERSRFPKDIDVRVGQVLQVQLADGRELPVTVENVTESKVKIDANHPLAGTDLSFHVRLLEITESVPALDPGWLESFEQ